MAVKLHRCSGTWAKLGSHPCHRVQRALEEQGVEHEVVLEGYGLPRSRRRTTIERTGQRMFPWIEFEDGSVYREESQAMADRIRAGSLADAPRSQVPPAAAAAPVA